MIIIMSIFLIIVALFSIKKTKKIINPVMVLFSIWGIIFFLSSLRLFDLRETPNSVYWILFVGLLFFFMGFYIHYRYKENKDIIPESAQVQKYRINYTIVYILSGITIVYFCTKIPYIITGLFSKGGLAAIRNMAQDSTSVLNRNSPIINAVRILIVLPFSMAIIPLTSVDYWFGNKNRKMLVICILIIALRVLTEGGRILIIYFLLHMIICRSFAINREQNENKKIKVGNNVLAIVVVLFVVLITSLSRSQGRLLRDSYYYFSIEPYMFNIWSENVKEAGLFGYGEASVNGFIFPIVYFLKNLLGIPFPSHWNSVYNMILETDSSWQIIGGNLIRANAYVSYFWFFYLDFRMFGIIFGNFVYGLISAFSFKAVQRNLDMKKIALFSMLIQSLLLSFVKFQLSNLYFAVSIIYIVLVLKKANLAIGDKNE